MEASYCSMLALLIQETTCVLQTMEGKEEQQALCSLL